MILYIIYMIEYIDLQVGEIIEELKSLDIYESLLLNGNSIMVEMVWNLYLNQNIRS